MLLSTALVAGLPAAAQRATEAPPVPAELPGKAVVIGRLLRPDGSRVDSGLISFVREGYSGPLFVADDRGRFEIDVEPGVYDVYVQTGSEQAERMGAVELHAGVQSFGDVRTRAGQPGFAAETETTMGNVIAIVSWDWKMKLRHPVLYVRSVRHRNR